jgi:hypothetical protein
MSYPLVPPPLSDTGAWSIPRTLQRWLDINPITRLTRTQAYITLPAFNVNVNWLGFSDIVASFNYEGPNNFSLTGFNIEPNPSPNYLLCIMWRDSKGNVKRYKLWSGVGEVFYFPCYVYNGQKIAKNFRFEIWSTNNTPAIQTKAIQIYTSLLGKQDYRYGSDFTLVSNDAVCINFSESSNTIELAMGQQYGIPYGGSYYTLIGIPAGLSLQTFVYTQGNDTGLFENDHITPVPAGPFTATDAVYFLQGPHFVASTSSVSISNVFAVPITFPLNSYPQSN